MANVEVTYADQQQINTFNKLNQRFRECEAEAKAQKALLEDLDDASNELILVDDDQIRFVVGECFLHVDSDEAESRIQDAQSEAQNRVTKVQSEISELKANMAQLKKELYGKFGDSINLEDE
ncbi:hypothetical protein WJX73_005594 [Symbiochloris irregularis]|uniref:Prefoldin subunit 4 n=1 Tax=Symbiochloris irregularis TaxID=706552 RepID=A0AAW1PU87_9CHLO